MSFLVGSKCFNYKAFMMHAECKSCYFCAVLFVLIIGIFSPYSLIMAEEDLVVKAQNRSYPGFEKENASEWEGPFFFIQGADTQFGMMDTYCERKENPTWDEEMELARTAIAAVNAMTPRPRFFVVCGDLIHAFPGNAFRKAQENDFIRVFKDLNPDIPLVCVCGNHDVGDTPTQESMQIYKNKFGDDYFTFYTAGVMFIVLNSQFYKDSSLVPELAQDQDRWLEEQLTEAKSGKYKHVVVFQHIPWFINKPDEENGYFNIDIGPRTTMLQKFYDANVRSIFCGHWHGNAGGFFKDMELIVTSAVGCQLRGDKSGFRVVKLGENGIEHQYYALEDAPKNISLT